MMARNKRVLKDSAMIVLSDEQSQDSDEERLIEQEGGAANQNAVETPGNA